MRKPRRTWLVSTAGTAGRRSGTWSRCGSSGAGAAATRGPSISRRWRPTACSRPPPLVPELGRQTDVHVELTRNAAAAVSRAHYPESLPRTPVEEARKKVLRKVDEAIRTREARDRNQGHAR